MTTTITAVEAAIELSERPTSPTSKTPSTSPEIDNDNDNTDSNLDLYPRGLKLIMTVLALSLTVFLVALDEAIIAQAIPSITQQLGGIGNIAWYGTAYKLSNTAFNMVWGKAYKFWRLKRTYMLAIVIFEVGNVICATAQSSSAVVVGRVVSGLGGGGLMTGSFIIMALIAKPKYRPMFMGITSVVYGVSSVAGPLLGGALVDGLSWRWCFWINLPIGALATAIILVYFSQPFNAVPIEAPLQHKLIRMDINGGVIVCGSLSCFILAMHWLGTYDWSSTRIIVSLVASILLALVFCLNERLMGDKGIIQPHLLRHPRVLRNSIFTFFFSGAFFPLMYLLPLQFQSVNNDSAAKSGVRLIPFLLTISVFTFSINVLLSFWKHYSPCFLVGAVFATAGTAWMYTFDASTALADWTASEILTSIGIGVALQVPVVANNAAVGVEDIPAATSLALFLANVGTVLSVGACQGAFTKGLVAGVKQRLPQLDPALVVSAGVTTLRTSFPADQLPAVLESYLEGCKDSHLVPVACGSLATVVAVEMVAHVGWRRVMSWVRKPHSF